MYLFDGIHYHYLNTRDTTLKPNYRWNNRNLNERLIQVILYELKYGQIPFKIIFVTLSIYCKR